MSLCDYKPLPGMPSLTLTLQQNCTLYHIEKEGMKADESRMLRQSQAA